MSLHTVAAHDPPVPAPLLPLASGGAPPDSAGATEVPPAPAFAVALASLDGTPPVLVSPPVPFELVLGAAALPSGASVLQPAISMTIAAKYRAGRSLIACLPHAKNEASTRLRSLNSSLRDQRVKSGFVRAPGV